MAHFGHNLLDYAPLRNHFQQAESRKNQDMTTPTAPDFELLSTEGKPVQLYPITAMWPVLLVFFSARDDACRRLLPMIAQFERAYRGADLEILAISQDSRMQARDEMKGLGWSGRVLVDPAPHLVSASYGIRDLPALVLIGPENQVLAMAQGPDDASINAVGRAVANLTRWNYLPMVPVLDVASRK